MKKLILFATLIFLAALAGWKQFTAPPVARIVLDDGGTEWRPQDNPNVGAPNEHIAIPTTFRTMHVGLNNSDHLWIATAPEQALAWVRPLKSNRHLWMNTN